MNIELTEEQRRQLEAYPEAPVRLIDAESKREYVLVSAEVYDRLCSLLDDGLDRRQVGALIEAAMREEDEGDPLLESYQKYGRPS
jgi:hypothetical protein